MIQHHMGRFYAGGGYVDPAQCHHSIPACIYEAQPSWILLDLVDGSSVISETEGDR
jgi:hypothetical protein